MTSPMPETMSPREKVAAVLKAWCEGGLLQDYGSVSDAILASLASSSDHAELARLAEAGVAAAESGDLQALADSDQAFFTFFGPRVALALIAENAALRETNTEAERKLADERLNYEGAMSDIDSLLKVLIRRINGEADLASAAEWVRLNYPIAAEAIISKEAERG